MEFLMKEMVEARPEGTTIVEGSPKQSKGSNGVVERAAQEIEGGMRSLISGGWRNVWDTILTLGKGLQLLCRNMRLTC